MSFFYDFNHLRLSINASTSDIYIYYALHRVADNAVANELTPIAKQLLPSSIILFITCNFTDLNELCIAIILFTIHQTVIFSEFNMMANQKMESCSSLLQSLHLQSKEPVECIFEGLLFWTVCDYDQLATFCTWQELMLTSNTKFPLALLICEDVHSWVSIHIFARSTKGESFFLLRIKLP